MPCETKAAKRGLSRKRQKPVEPLPILSKAFKARFLTRSPNNKCERLPGSNVWVDQLFPVQPGQPYRQPFEEARRGRKLRLLRSQSLPIKKRSPAMLGLAAGCRFHRGQLIQRAAFRLCFRLSLLYNRVLASRRDARSATR